MASHRLISIHCQRITHKCIPFVWLFPLSHSYLSIAPRPIFNSIDCALSSKLIYTHRSLHPSIYLSTSNRQTKISKSSTRSGQESDVMWKPEPKHTRSRIWLGLYIYVQPESIHVPMLELLTEQQFEKPLQWNGNYAQMDDWWFMSYDGSVLFC